MALSDRPAERHRQVAGLFTERVRGTRSWDTPSPVAGWAARDVVRHLTEWFPGFLASGTGIELPRGPSVDENPVAAWQCVTLAWPGCGSAHLFPETTEGHPPLAVAGYPHWPGW
jgi:Mycothiol maleylpyruvate isomerase N-terminal domain